MKAYWIQYEAFCIWHSVCNPVGLFRRHYVNSSTIGYIHLDIQIYSWESEHHSKGTATTITTNSLYPSHQCQYVVSHILYLFFILFFWTFHWLIGMNGFTLCKWIRQILSSTYLLKFIGWACCSCAWCRGEYSLNVYIAIQNIYEKFYIYEIISVLFESRSVQWRKKSKVNLLKIEKVAWTIYLLFLYIKFYFVRPERKYANIVCLATFTTLQPPASSAAPDLQPKHKGEDEDDESSVKIKTLKSFSFSRKFLFCVHQPPHRSRANFRIGKKRHAANDKTPFKKM